MKPIELNPTHASPRPLSFTRSATASQIEETASNYIKYIKLCYRNHPESLGYYAQLVDYLEGCRGSLLQKPSVFDVIKALDGSNSFSVFSFPFYRADLDLPQLTPRITVLEGFLSPDCIAQLGSKMSLRPEFFLGHLDLVLNQGSQYQQRYYEIPTLPSRQDNIVSIRLVTLGKSENASSVHSYTVQRHHAENNCYLGQKELITEKRYGAARFRKVHIHNEQFFSVEQTVSFSISNENQSSWSGSFLACSTISLAN